MKKRILVCFIAAALCFGLMPAPFALAQEGGGNAGQIANTGGSNPAEDGSWHEAAAGAQDVRISKTIEPTGIENYFDITLAAQTRRATADQSISAVVVLDVSNTMNSEAGGSTRIANAKATANQFIDQFCGHENLDEDRQLGVVAFNTNASWAVPMAEANSADDAAGLKGEVNAIAASPDAPADADHVRFTNIEGGLELARQELAADDAVNKYVIMLTDGFPTTYVESYDADTPFIRGYDPYTPQATSSATGEFYDEVADAPCSYGTSYSDRAAILARETAVAMKAEGVNVFCVGMSIGDQTIQYYREVSDRMAQSTPPYSVMDCTGPNYEIDPTGTDAYRDWLGNAIAGGPVLDKGGHVRYSDGDDLAQLESAYESFLYEIELTQTQDFTELLTSDPMGEEIEFLHFFDKGGEPADSLSGDAEEGAENTASFDAETKAVGWDLLQSGFAAAQEGENTEIFTYTLTYRVRVANEAKGFAFGEALPTNGAAFLGFATEADPEGGRLAYPDPSVRAYEGSLAFVKLSEAAAPNGESDDAPLAGAEFSLVHSDSCSVCAAAREAGAVGENVSIASMSAVSDEAGSVTFAGIPSGHDYVLSESSAPEGYEPSERTSAISVHYGETTVAKTENSLLISNDGAYAALNERIPGEPETPERPDDPSVPTAPETPDAPEGPEASMNPGSFARQFAATGDPLNPIPIAAAGAIAAAIAAFSFARRRIR